MAESWHRDGTGLVQEWQGDGTEMMHCRDDAGWQLTLAVVMVSLNPGDFYQNVYVEKGYQEGAAQPWGSYFWNQVWLFFFLCSSGGLRNVARSM